MRSTFIQRASANFNLIQVLILDQYIKYLSSLLWQLINIKNLNQNSWNYHFTNISLTVHDLNLRESLVFRGESWQKKILAAYCVLKDAYTAFNKLLKYFVCPCLLKEKHLSPANRYKAQLMSQEFREVVCFLNS